MIKFIKYVAFHKDGGNVFIVWHFPKIEGIFSLSENFSPEKYFTLKYNILE